MRRHDVPGHEIDGACANLHRIATGEWPGRNAHKGHLASTALIALVAAASPAQRVPWWGPLAPINKATGDGRIFPPGIMQYQSFPMAFRWQEKGSRGHDGAVTVATIEGAKEIMVDGEPTIWAYGYWLDPEIIPEVTKAQHQVDNGVTGPSVDLDSYTAALMEHAETGKKVASLSQGRMRAATLVNIPAFADLRITTGKPGDKIPHFPDAVTASLEYDEETLAHFAVNGDTWHKAPIAPREALFDADDAVSRIEAWANGDPAKMASAFLWVNTDNGPLLGRQGYRLPWGDVIDGQMMLVYHAAYSAAALLSDAHGGLPNIPDEDKAKLRSVISEIYQKLSAEFNDPQMVAPWDRQDAQADGEVEEFAPEDDEEQVFLDSWCDCDCVECQLIDSDTFDAANIEEFLGRYTESKHPRDPRKNKHAGEWVDVPGHDAHGRIKIGGKWAYPPKKGGRGHKRAEHEPKHAANATKERGPKDPYRYQGKRRVEDAEREERQAKKAPEPERKSETRVVKKAPAAKKAVPKKAPERKPEPEKKAPEKKAPEPGKKEAPKAAEAPKGKTVVAKKAGHKVTPAQQKALDGLKGGDASLKVNNPSVKVLEREGFIEKVPGGEHKRDPQMHQYRLTQKGRDHLGVKGEEKAPEAPKKAASKPEAKAEATEAPLKTGGPENKGVHEIRLPDGTVAKRTSKTNHYTHAVLVTRDNAQYVKHAEEQAKKAHDPEAAKWWQAQADAARAAGPETHYIARWSKSPAAAEAGMRNREVVPQGHPGYKARVVAVGEDLSGPKVKKAAPPKQDTPENVVEAPPAPQAGKHPASEAGVRAAFDDVLKAQGVENDPDGTWVNIADLRDRMGGTREEQDAALKAIEQRSDVNIVPQANQKVLDTRTRAAAVRIGGQDKTHLTIIPRGLDTQLRKRDELDRKRLAEQAQKADGVKAQAEEFKKLRSREKAREFLKDMPKRDLVALAAEVEMPHRKADNAQQIRDALVRYAGAGEDHDVIVGQRYDRRGAVDRAAAPRAREGTQAAKKTPATVRKAVAEAKSQGGDTTPKAPTGTSVKRVRARDAAEAAKMRRADRDARVKELGDHIAEIEQHIRLEQRELKDPDNAWVADAIKAKIAERQAEVKVLQQQRDQLKQLPDNQLDNARKRESLDPAAESLGKKFSSGEKDAQRKRIRAGAQGKKERLTLPDGSIVFSKQLDARGLAPGHNGVAEADSEELASLMGRAIGAPVPVVARADDTHILMDWVEGKTFSEILPHEKRTAEATPEFVLMGLLDMLTYNRDRHGGNIMAAGGKPVAIDNGLAWSQLGRNPGKSRAEMVRRVLDNPPMGPAGQWWRQGLAPADAQRMRKNLEALRSAFRSRGREEWLDFSLAILSELAKRSDKKRLR